MPQMTDLYTLRDARDSDAELINFYASSEGMDVMPNMERIRVAVNEDDQVVGFCRIQESADGTAYVNPIVVSALWQGFGVGRALIEDAHAREGTLCLVSRGPITGFYRKLGFVDLSWDEADLEAASEDCDNCIHRAECQPQPMKLEG